MILPGVVYSVPDDPLSRFRTNATERTNAGDPLSRRHCAKYHCLISCVPLDGGKKGYRWPIRFRRRGGMSIIEPVKEERWKSENKTPVSVLPCNGLTAILYWHKKVNNNFNMNMQMNSDLSNDYENFFFIAVFNLTILNRSSTLKSITLKFHFSSLICTF